MEENFGLAIRSFSQVYGNAYFRDPATLCQAGWTRFAEGAFEIAEDLMSRVVETASSLEERFRFLWELQGMRIAAQDFATAAAVRDVLDTVAPEARGGIAMTKGWALTMLGNGAAGRAQLEQARSLLGDTLAGTRFALYLENIYALSLVRYGEADAALEVERRIEHMLAERYAVGESDRALEYVNTINQARLLRLTGDLEACEQAYQRAFALTLGTRTDNDLVYTNFCLARVLAARGNGRAAMSHWLRAALHWVAAECPEALTARIAGGVLGRRVETPESCIEELSQALDNHLLEAAVATGIELPELLAV